MGEPIPETQRKTETFVWCQDAVLGKMLHCFALNFNHQPIMSFTHYFLSCMFLSTVAHVPDYEPDHDQPAESLLQHFAEEMGRGVRAWEEPLITSLSFSITHAEVPAVSIARSKRAMNEACPRLAGKQKGNLDQNATRDVTAMLSKSGYTLHVKRENLVPRLLPLTSFFDCNNFFLETSAGAFC